MTNYKNTIIYKIEHATNPELVYVGHTTNMIKRKNQHKHHCIENTRKLYQTIRENGGWECFTMVPIMEFPCETKIQAEIQEEKCRVELKATLNALKAHTTPEERKEQIKKNQTENQEKRNEQQKKRYHELSIEDRKKIAEERKEYKKEWHAKNKDEISQRRSQKYMCTCGVECSLSNSARHERSKFHMENKK
jgi:hypothetical protein